MNKNSNHELLVNEIDIVDEISKYIDLERKGNNHLGVCPFHSDNNPSLSINSEKKIFKCFVCSTGGDVIKFHSLINKLRYQDSVEQLASIYKIPIKVEKNYVTEIKAENLVLNDIKVYYISALFSSLEGKGALDYLIKRKLNIETIKEFEIGFSYPDAKQLYKYLELKIEKNSNYSHVNIEKLNHFTNTIDNFRNRIMIPIYQNRQLVAFAGRSIGEDKIKYLNSQSGNIFNKSDVLYNFDRAIKHAINKDLIIVEGYFDVVRAYQNGIKNVVAIMGLNISQKQIETLKANKIENIYLALDNDKAGDDGKLLIGEMLYINKFKIKVINYGEANDLDVFFNANNNQQFIELVNNSQDFKMFQIKHLVKSYNLNNLEQKESFIKQIMKNINFENQFMQEEIFRKLSELTSLDINFFKNKNIIKATASRKPNNKIKHNGIHFSNNEDLIIEYCLESPDNYKEIENKLKVKNKKMIQYVDLFNNIGIYYEQHPTYDYVSFLNLFPNQGHLLDTIREKEVKVLFNENENFIDEMIDSLNKKTWLILKGEK